MGTGASAQRPVRNVGRYALFDAVASGGMATVHIGRLEGPGGFTRTVAIKRLHPHLAAEPEFVAMLLDEARTASRIHHPNVIDTLDIVADEGELFIVMEYVHGESLSALLRRCIAEEARPPLDVLVAIVSSALHGLHAAHEALSEAGEPLRIVHRDISPQNLLIGVDGHTRVLDFGVAKAAGRLQTTREGKLKGKLAYMPPEQVRGEAIDRRTDVYAAAVVLWETIACKRMYQADSDAHLLQLVLAADVESPGALVPGVPPALDAIVMRGLARDPALRFQTAHEMATALERCVPPALPATVAGWVRSLASESLSKRAARIAEIERDPSSHLRAVQAIVDDPSEGLQGATGSAVVTDSARHSPPLAARRRFWVLTGAAAIVAALGLTGFVATRRPAAAQSPVPAASPPPMPTASDLPGAASSAPDGNPRPVAPPVTASADPAPPSRPPRAGLPKTSRPTAKPPGATSPPDDCSPPYTEDPVTGHRSYKRWCLQR